MKKKIFIAAAAVVLAVGGAFAAKAHKFATVFYYSSPSVCAQDPLTVTCTDPGDDCLDAHGNHVYQTKINGSTCGNELGLE